MLWGMYVEACRALKFSMKVLLQLTNYWLLWLLGKSQWFCIMSAVKDHFIYLNGLAYWKATRVEKRDYIARQDVEWVRCQ